MAKNEKTLLEHSVGELHVKYESTCRQLFELKNEYRLNRQLKKPHLLKKTKKDIARILTVAQIMKNQELIGDKK